MPSIQRHFVLGKLHDIIQRPKWSGTTWNSNVHSQGLPTSTYEDIGI